MYLLLLIGAILLTPSIGLAAYQNPTVISNERQAAGFIKVNFAFAGNAGEVTVQREYLVRPTSTATHLRNWIYTTIQELNALHTASVIPALQPGQTVPALAPVATPPSAKDSWMMKFDRYKRMQGSGIVNATLTSDLAALKADLEATYQAGYID